VDFERLREPFDVARFKADRLQEEVRDNRIMLEINAERLSTEAQNRILELGRKGQYSTWTASRTVTNGSSPDATCGSSGFDNEIRELRKLSWQRRWSQ
jgi:hypothetical protein